MSKEGGFVKPGNLYSWGHVQNYDKYLRGELEKQKEDGTIKTNSALYDSLNCNRDLFTKQTMSYMQYYHPEGDLKRKAYAYTISFSPKDNVENGGNLTPELAHKISMEFANKYFNEYPTLAVTHIDKDHLHTQIIVGNVNINNGKSWQCDQDFFNQMRKDVGKLYIENGLTNSLTELKEQSIINKETGEKIFRKKQKTETIHEIKVRERVGYTNKDAIGSALHEQLKYATSFGELQNRLKEKYEINVEERGKKHYVFSHPDCTDKNGKIRSFREDNLGKEYSMTREEIERKLAENQQREKEEFEKMNDVEKDAYTEKRMMLDERSRMYQQQAQIKNEYEDTRDKANSNADDMNKNEVRYHQSKNDFERHQLMQEREKLFEIQKDLQREMVELNKKFEEIQSKIDDLNKEIEKKYDDKDKRIINDTEHINSLPIDNDLNKLPQTVEINNTMDKTRNEEDIITAHDLNGAEEINKGLEEQRRLNNADRYEKDTTGQRADRTGREKEERENAVSFVRTEPDNRKMGSSISGGTEENSNFTEGQRGVNKTEFENGRESQELRGLVEESRERLEQSSRAVEQSRERLEQSSRAVEQSRERLKQSERAVEQSREELGRTERAVEKSSGTVERKDGESQESGRRKHKIIESQGLHI